MGRTLGRHPGMYVGSRERCPIDQGSSFETSVKLQGKRRLTGREPTRNNWEAGPGGRSPPRQSSAPQRSINKVPAGSSVRSTHIPSALVRRQKSSRVVERPVTGRMQHDRRVARRLPDTGVARGHNPQSARQRSRGTPTATATRGAPAPNHVSQNTSLLRRSESGRIVRTGSRRALQRVDGTKARTIRRQVSTPAGGGEGSHVVAHLVGARSTAVTAARAGRPLVSWDAEERSARV